MAIVACLALLTFVRCSTPQPVAPHPPEPSSIPAADRQAIEELGLKIVPNAKIEHGSRVVLRAIIGKNGKVGELEFVAGNLRFLPEAVKAVRGWHYKPYILDGEPVEVETTIDISIHLVGG